MKRIHSRRMRLSFTELSRKLKILRDGDIMFLTAVSASLFSLSLSLSLSFCLFRFLSSPWRWMLVIVVGECKSRRATSLARKLTWKKGIASRKQELWEEEEKVEGAKSGKRGRNNWYAFQGIFNRNYGKSRVDTGAKTEIKRTSRSINTEWYITARNSN